jgi:FAD/FMN-containing dehydrogenase
MLGTVAFIKLMISLIPDGAMLLRGIPKLILMIEFNGETQEEVDTKINNMRSDLLRFHMAMERDDTAEKSKKFWIMRRQSFNLLRSKVKDKHTAPFIDDLVVNPPNLVEFLPKLRVIIKKYNLLATIAGHMGDGNFHIIPLMKLEEKSERDKLLPAMREVNDLVLQYKGSLSGEHNDGLIRGPWLERMYGTEMLGVFKQVKNIFDPKDILNPHKKADANWDYSFSHVRDHF